MRPVGVSRDFLSPDGTELWGDIGLAGLDSAGIPWEYLDDDVAELRPEDIEDRPAVLFAGPAVTARTFDGVTRAPAVLARFGVGYDAVDLAACTAAGTVVTITPDGARRPVATAALGMLLGVQLNLGIKDRLTRTGRWDERTAWMGFGLTGRTIGMVGFGSTATDLAGLLAPFKPRVLAYDPYCPPERAASLGAELVSLDRLARESDAVVILAVLTAETHHLIDAAFLEAMPRHSTLVNVARGPIVDEAALVAALQSGSIRGAALDVFEQEPVAADNPLLALDQVLVTPHSVAWMDEMSTGNGGSAVRAILATIRGENPEFIVNRDVLGTDAHRAAADRIREESRRLAHP